MIWKWASLPEVLDHGLGAGVDFELLEDAFHVALHSPFADTERVSDFFDEVAFAQEREDFMLAWREFGELPERRTGR